MAILRGNPGSNRVFPSQLKMIFSRIQIAYLGNFKWQIDPLFSSTAVVWFPYSQLLFHHCVILQLSASHKDRR